MLTTTALAVLSGEISGPLIMPTLAERGRNWFRKLRELLERMVKMAGALSDWEYALPRLWALYIVAMWEW